MVTACPTTPSATCPISDGFSVAVDLPIVVATALQVL